MAHIKTSLAIVGISLVLAATASSCQSAPQRSAAEKQIVPADSELPLARQLDANIDRSFGVWSDPIAQDTLDKIVASIAQSDPAYAKMPAIKVHVLATTVPYVAPGLVDSIYVSRGALGGIRYENELAFLLATQVSLLKDRATSRNLAALRGQDVGQSIVSLPTSPAPIQKDYLASGWFDGGGLFDFGGVEYLRAEQEGVRLAYTAKYDPRGSVTLIQNWTTTPFEREARVMGKIMPEPVERLAAARAEIAKLSPLRDPIVTSHSFEVLVSRLETKKAKSKRKVGATATK